MFSSDFTFIGNFQPNDGTIDFYLRVKSLTNKNTVILDLGAGRGAYFHDEKSTIKREIRYLKPHVKKYICADIDKAVFNNQTSHENLLIKNNIINLKDNSVDLIICDYVLEHIDDTNIFFVEINRVLKKGGYFCARTPSKYHYVSIFSQIIKSKMRKKLISKSNNRLLEDQFDCYYKLNTINQLKNLFKGYKDYSISFRTNPSYYFNNKLIFIVMKIFHHISPKFLVSNLFIFLKK